MRITTYLLEEFIEIKAIDIDTICNTLSDIGLEIEACEAISLPERVVVGKVIKKQAHINADRLSVCSVDVGNEVLEIVCGAKNVAQDQFVAVALQGAKLAFDDKELEIKQNNIRGVDSFGMLCSSVELGLPKLNEGIMLLDESIGELTLGKALRDFDIFKGFVLEISLTPNRGDCLCVLGIARELKSIFDLSLKNHKEYLSTNQIGIGRRLQISLKNKVDSLLLYKLVDFKQKTTPLNIQLALAINGNLSASIIQNFTNYVTYMTGVILNAYGADYLYKDKKESNNEILWLCVQKNAQGFEEVSIDKRLSCIGVNNFAKQDLDSNESIIFEASYIEPNQISRLLFENKAQAQDKAITFRTTRGSNPDLSLGINFLSLLLDAYTDCFIYDGVQEVKQESVANIIRTKFSSIAKIIGYKIDREEISRILKQLDFYLELKTNDDSFSVEVPPYRHDMQTEQDLAEEILRIFGVNNIPSKPHIMQEESKITPAYLDYKNQRDLMSKALSHNFVECIHYLFYQKERLQKFGFEVLQEQKALHNPITLELNTLRTSLLPALLDSLVRNQNFGYKNMRLCEIGSVYDTQRNEKTKMAFVVNGLQQKEAYPNPKGVKWDFYTFGRIISQIIGNFALQKPEENTLPSLFHPYQSANIFSNEQHIGIIAKLHPSFAKQMDLHNVFMCEVEFANLTPKHLMFKEFSRLPTSFRDLTILLDKHIPFYEIRKFIEKEKIEFLHNLYPLDVFIQEDKKIALSIRLEIKSFNALKEEDIQLVVQKVLRILEEKCFAKLKM